MHVLIVDDSSFQRRWLRRMAESMGNEVSEAVSGPSALSWLREKLADVVLLDLLMPGASGPELISEIARSAPVVVITADSQKLIAAECVAAGAAVVLNKPVRLETLEDVLLDIQQSLPEAESCS